MNNLLNNAQQRAIFQGTCAALVLRMQLLEQKLTLALMSGPTLQQQRRLLGADEALGRAAIALQEAGRLVGEL